MKRKTISVPCLAILIIVTLISQARGNYLLNWFWSKSENTAPVLVSDGLPLIDIPYEQLTEDEKFLKEAAKFVTDIQVSSPLEVCQHKVILKIKTSCSSMTEEQLAKLSVNLLNCQSENEGRRTYICTEEMTIKQCTSNMDADTWNAYHLMSNRARAVCYAARSHQFRALTELTVNKLMQSARSQIEKLAHLKESQDRLEEQTISAQKLVESNIQELTQEKALIKAGHLQLASMAEDIKKKLENASKEILEQTSEQNLNHQEILKDLEKIQIQAQNLWNSTSRIIEQNRKAALKYEETLKKLEKINETIIYVWDVTNKMRSEIDKKLGWLTDYMGATGENLERVYRTILHVGYLFAAMIFASFLQAPFLTRSAILGIVPLNLFSYLKHGFSASLDFISLTFLIALITAMHYLMNAIHYLLQPRPKESNSKSIAKSTKHNNDEPKQRLSLFSKFFRGISNIWHSLSNQVCHSFGEIRKKLNPSYLLCISTEELSCSYVPARKYENLSDKGYTSVSDDSSDYSEVFDNKNLIHDNDSLTGSVLRRNVTNKNDSPYTTVFKRNLDPRIRKPISVSCPKEITSASIITPISRALCSAHTRSGNPCRLMPQKGQNFCHRHTSGSSSMGD